jgi:hypothetical protein
MSDILPFGRPMTAVRGAADLSARQSEPLAPAAAAQLPVTIWTTDRDLTLTFVQSPLLPAVDIAPGRLVGVGLARLVCDGQEDHAIVAAHRTALAGNETAVTIDWGEHTFAGRVAPLRDPAGHIVGCVGVGHAIVRQTDDPFWPARGAVMPAPAVWQARASKLRLVACLVPLPFLISAC